MFQQRTTAVIATLLLLLVAPGVSSDESRPQHQRRNLGLASSFSFTNLMYKLHFCKHPSRMCGPPKCGGPGPKPPHLCNYYHCSSSDCSWEASIEACGDDSSCLSSYYYYQDQNGSSSSSSGSSSSGSSSSSSSGGYDYSGSSSSSSSGGGSDGYDSSSNYDSDGRSGSVSVSNGGSINQIQNSEAATFNPMPYVIGGFLLVGMLAFIVMKKRNGTNNKELTEALGPTDEELDGGGIVAQRLQRRAVESGAVPPASSSAKERISTKFIKMVHSQQQQPTVITTIPEGTEVSVV